MSKLKAFLSSVLVMIGIAALILIELWRHSGISEAKMFSWENVSSLLLWMFCGIPVAAVVMACLIFRYKKLSTKVGKEEADKKIRYFFGDISENDPSPKLIKWLRRNFNLGSIIVLFAIVLVILLLMCLISIFR